MLLFSKIFSTRRCILILVVLKFALAGERPWEEILKSQIEEYRDRHSQPCSEIGGTFISSVFEVERELHQSVLSINPPDNSIELIEEIIHAHIHYLIHEMLILSGFKIEDILKLMRETLYATDQSSTTEDLKVEDLLKLEKDFTIGDLTLIIDKGLWSGHISRAQDRLWKSVECPGVKPGETLEQHKQYVKHRYEEALKAVNPETTLAHSKQFYHKLIEACIEVLRENESAWHNKATRPEWKLNQHNNSIQQSVEEFKESLRTPQ